MRRNPNDIALKLLGTPYEQLDVHAKRVASHVAERTHLAQNALREGDATPTIGQRAADAVASFGGSVDLYRDFRSSPHRLGCAEFIHPRQVRPRQNI
jgi:hypothetical protein